MGNLEFYLAGIGVVLAISIYASKLSVKFGVPLLLVFGHWHASWKRWNLGH